MSRLSFFLGMAWLVVVSALCLSACGQEVNARNVGDLLERLKSEDANIRKQARSDLSEALFLKEDLPALYEGIRYAYPDDQAAENSTRSLLLHVLEGVYDDETINFITFEYDKLPKNSHIRASALRVLAAINTQSSLEQLRSLLLAKRPNLEGNEAYVLEPLHDDPSQLNALFPQILALASENSYKFPLYELMEAGVEAEALDAQEMRDSLQLLVADFEQSQNKMRRMRSSSSEAYIKQANIMKSTLRSLAYFPADEEARKLLSTSLTDSRKDIKLTAAISCVQSGTVLADTSLLSRTLEKLAKDPETHNQLYLELERIGKLSSFPQTHLTQEEFARADLTEWLAAPANKGKYPSKMELLESRDHPDGKVYVYKFQYPGTYWMVGLSGPQPAGSQEFLPVGYLTGSKYRVLEDMSIDRHVNLIEE